MEEKPNYYAVIPANVRYSDITANAKLLYGEITALSNKDGYCYATNRYFAELYGVTVVSISKWIKELSDAGFIETEIIYKNGTKGIDSRHIRIVDSVNKTLTPFKEKLKGGIKEKFKDNNINNIIINNNIKRNNKEKTVNIDYPNEEWQKLFEEWLSYKKEKKQSYKSVKSIQLCFNKLLEYSDENIVLAKNIIERSIVNNWSGFFPLESKNKSNKMTVEEAMLESYNDFMKGKK